MWLWLKPLIYFLFCWYKNVLRGAAGERECVWDWEIERGEMEQFKVPFKHLSFPGISKVCECNVSLRRAQIDLLDCVCWQTAMSFFSLNSPAPRPSLQSTSLSPPLCHPSICLFLFVSHFFSVSTCLPIACPCVILAFYLWIVLISIFQIDNNNNKKKNTNICFLYKLLYFLYNFPTNPNICGLHSHQTQADSTAVRQASDPSPHGRNEHSLVVGSQSQNHGTNATTPNTTRYQTPACCDIPCALIVQHSYDSTSPPKLTPKMRMTTFATSPPTPRLYIQ